MATKRVINKPTAVSELRRIATRSGGHKSFGEAEVLIEQLYDIRKPAIETYRKLGATLIAQRDVVPNDEFDNHVQLQCDLLRVLSVRERLETTCLTYQEHRLIGSTQPDRYISAPYTPLALLDGELALEEVRVLRALHQFILAAGIHYGKTDPRKPQISIVLEALDDNGITVRDPRAIDMNRLNELFERDMPVDWAINAAVIACTKSENFPFKRD